MLTPIEFFCMNFSHSRFFSTFFSLTLFSLQLQFITLPSILNMANCSIQFHFFFCNNFSFYGQKAPNPFLLTHFRIVKKKQNDVYYILIRFTEGRKYIFVISHIKTDPFHVRFCEILLNVYRSD